MPNDLLCLVDNRLRLPAGLPIEFIRRLRQATTHDNPEYGRKRGMGMWTGSVPATLRTWVENKETGEFFLPRGAIHHLRRIAPEFDFALRWKDLRVSSPIVWPPLLIQPRPYQEDGIQICVTKEQGIVRAPTGSGKTYMALATLPRLGQRSLVIVRDTNLMKQWMDRAETSLNFRRRAIGVVGAGKKTIGDHLTVALQQTLYSKSFPLDEFAQQFGAVIIDEVHDTAARTVNETVNAFPARARLGFSADESRRDRKQFLIHDSFGEVIYSVEKRQLEKQGDVVPVIVRLVPTEFRADWYSEAEPAERDFTRLIGEMSQDDARNELIRQVVLELVEAKRIPALVFTHRREHAKQLAERDIPADGIPTGLLLGGDDVSFNEAKRALLSGALKVAVGTFKACGQGIDIPNVMAGVCATPLGANRQFFGQVRGRICRVVPGKTVGHLYYLWDRHVFPDAGRNIFSWNDGLVEVFDRRRKSWVSFS